MLAATALAIGAGVKGAYSYGKGRGWWGAQPPKQKMSDEEKLYGDELKRMTKEGRYSPATLALIRNKALQGAYGMANRGASKIGQNLSRRGFEGSAIIGEAIKPLYTEAINTAGETASGLAVDNEKSKLDAFKSLGSYGERKSQIDYQNALAKYTHKTESYDSAINSFVGAGVGFANAYDSSKAGQFDLSQFKLDGGGYDQSAIWSNLMQMENKDEALKIARMLLLKDDVFD